ncbi:MAG: redoxin family protein [Hyphomonadaceae bacterium]|nr:redoxin family protein [Hyphomonadaceae bacterium]
MKFSNREKVTLAAGSAAAAMITVAALMVSTASAAPVGELAPAFKENNTAGKEVQLSDFAGKTVVLEWTNNGCPFVQKHYNSTNMQKTQEAASKDGVIWISVISSKPGSQGYVSGAGADKLTKDRGAHPTHVLLDADGSMGRAYGAKTTPHMYVITPEGKIAYNGAIDSIQSNKVDDVPKATNYVTTALAALKAGKQPDPALTVPYGCDVKY